ncbi:unnamed protein product [Nippostrongylus brasiliensis]|uniref:Uncharacterized protein n=1 Tax=Nippostrongylus brasiliensis TaxID=27835 RepID=A0A0N4XQC8_NIPBR|nr:unnamed protein product [Nippostrongylus brasiliensis]
METDVMRSVSSSLRNAPRIISSATLSQLFTKTAAMLRWENMIDIRDSVVLG